MAIFEIVAVIATSSLWESVCFKKTHLIERMGLLTLIIFGEGIIVMLKGINAIVKSFGWTPATFGVVATALLVIVSAFSVGQWLNSGMFHYHD